MNLSALNIVNYKNIREASLTFSEKINCFIGHNGEGKTNLLDAIYYLSFCRSSNNPTDSQLITHDENFLMLEGVYEAHPSPSGGEGSLNDSLPDSRITILCGMKRGAKKSFKKDGKAYKRLSEHIGMIPLVLVTPQDTLLIEGGSEERRRFMDLVISQYDHTYIEALASCVKALQQRNALLKQEEPDVALLEIWEEQMARYGEILYRKRAAFIEEFVPCFQKIYSFVSGDKEKVELQYTSHCQRGKLLDVIQRDRMKDIAVGYSLHGVHRDDLDMLLGGYNMKREGSQGQCKTLVLAMKLAQFEFLKRTISQTTPLLLLDDIFDKLDAGRVEQIVKLVSTPEYGQIFITDTNRDHLDQILATSNLDYKLFNVKSGCLEEVLHQ